MTKYINSILTIILFVNLTSTLLEADEFSKKPLSFDDATQIIKQTPDKIDHILIERILKNVDTALGNSYFYDEQRGNFIEALKWVDLGIKACSTLTDSALSAQCLYTKGRVLDLEGRHQEAISFFNKADLINDNRDLRLSGALAAHLELAYISLYEEMDRTLQSSIVVEYRKDFAELMNRYDGKTKLVLDSLRGALPDAYIEAISRLAFCRILRATLYSFRENLPSDRVDLNLKVINNTVKLEEKLIQPANERGDWRAEAFGYYLLADLLFLIGIDTIAMENAERSIKIYNDYGDKGGKAFVYMRIGDYYSAPKSSPIVFNFVLFGPQFESSLGYEIEDPIPIFLDEDLYNASEYYDTAYSLFLEANSERGCASILLRKAYLNIINGDYIHANELYDQSLNLYKSNGDNIGEGSIYIHKTFLYIEKGDYFEASNTFVNFLMWIKEAQKVGYNDGVGHLLGLLANRYFYVYANYDKALFCHHLARQIYHGKKAFFHEADVIMKEEEIYDELNEYEKAMSCCYKALSLYDSVNIEGSQGNGGEIILTHSQEEVRMKQANVYMSMSTLSLSVEPDSALEYNKLMLEIGKEAGDMSGIFELMYLFNKVFIHIYKEEYDSAIMLAEEIEDHGALASVYALKGDYEKAIEHSELKISDLETEIRERKEEGASLRVQRLMESQLASAISVLGSQCIKAEQYDKAIELINRVNNMEANWEERFHKPWLYYFDLARAYAGKGAYDKAYNLYKTAIDSVESRYRTLKADEYRVSFLEDKMNVYENFVLFLFSHGFKDSAYYYVEHAKARTLSEMLSSPRVDYTREIKDESLKKELSHIETVLKKLQSSYYFETAKCRKLEVEKSPGFNDCESKRNSIKKELNSAKVEHENIISTLKIANPEYETVILGEYPITLKTSYNGQDKK